MKKIIFTFLISIAICSFFSFSSSTRHFAKSTILAMFAKDTIVVTGVARTRYQRTPRLFYSSYQITGLADDFEELALIAGRRARSQARHQSGNNETPVVSRIDRSDRPGINYARRLGFGGPRKQLD